MPHLLSVVLAAIASQQLGLLCLRQHPAATLALIIFSGTVLNANHSANL
jgi:hypothetical protein